MKVMYIVNTVMCAPFRILILIYLCLAWCLWPVIALFSVQDAISWREEIEEMVEGRFHKLLTGNSHDQK